MSYNRDVDGDRDGVSADVGDGDADGCQGSSQTMAQNQASRVTHSINRLVRKVTIGLMKRRRRATLEDSFFEDKMLLLKHDCKFRVEKISRSKAKDLLHL